MHLGHACSELVLGMCEGNEMVCKVQNVAGCSPILKDRRRHLVDHFLAADLPSPVFFHSLVFISYLCCNMWEVYNSLEKHLSSSLNNGWVDIMGSHIVQIAQSAISWAVLFWFDIEWCSKDWKCLNILLFGEFLNWVSIQKKGLFLKHWFWNNLLYYFSKEG